MPFLERAGTPALELACGSGFPLVELVERGYQVEGLDASQDMLDRCAARAAERGLEVTVHLAEMQSFSLGRRYRSIFLAGASFTLLTTDDDAARALERIYTHLEPGGSALIPLEVPSANELRKSLHRVREVRTDAGERLCVSMIALDESPDGRSLSRRLRYERISSTGKPETLERDWETRSWSRGQFRKLALGAHFSQVSFVSPAGGPVGLDDSVFVALLRRKQASAG